MCLWEGDAGTDGGLPSAESVTCHRNGMEVEFSSELGNYSWHVSVEGMYCYCPGPFCCSLKAGACLQG